MDHSHCSWPEKLLLRNPPVIVWRTLACDKSHHHPNFPNPKPFPLLSMFSPSPPAVLHQYPPLCLHCHDFGSFTVQSFWRTALHIALKRSCKPSELEKYQREECKVRLSQVLWETEACSPRYKLTSHFYNCFFWGRQPKLDPREVGLLR